MQNISRHSRILGGMLLIAANLATAAEVFTPDSQPTGWLSTPTVSYFDVSGGGEYFYRLGFYKDTWSGNVFAHNVSSGGVIDAANGPWGDVALNTAASLLNATDYSTGRIIATNGGPFRWASLTAAEQTALGSEAMLNYVRGDRSNEEPNGLNWRQREYVLGDILHSNIVYWDNGSQQSLFVGANDGMLHVFNANTGQERFAYVPSMLIPKLQDLSAKPYVHGHYVDGPISMANVDFSGTVKTVLVSGLGAGGQGIFALDVTSHDAADETAAAAKVMWEIGPSGDFIDLGHTYGAAQFARLGDAAVVIFSNGYMSLNGKAVLYVVNAESGALIDAIDTGTGSQLSPNGLSSPTLYDADGDGSPDYAYAGDLDGTMWKFDLANGDASELFMTFEPTQPITSAPVVTAHPEGGQMVNFATGRLLTTGDKVDASTFYVYGIWDQGSTVSKSDLVAQTLSDSTYGTDSVRTVSANALDWSEGGDKGWMVALAAGERVVGERPLYNAGRFYFVATNPAAPAGSNWVYELPALTGGEPSEPIFDLNEDGDFDSDDLASNGNVPIAKYLGSGVFSQPRLIVGDGLITTLYVFHPDQPILDGVPEPPPDPGVSNGHFDFDIYHPTVSIVQEVPLDSYYELAAGCIKAKDVNATYDSRSKYCDPAPAGYVWLTEITQGALCKEGKKLEDNEYLYTLKCNETEVIEYQVGDYAKQEHEHEYDDKYDVTGVNMLNASNPLFNLINPFPDEDTQFKILVFNQYLNPAAHLAVGEPQFESVRTYEGQADQRAPDFVADLPTYSRGSIGHFIFALPLDAFKNKNWWGETENIVLRAGLIPTQTSCVNKVSKEGVQAPPGPNGERFNGALGLQLIDPETLPGEIEMNHPTDKRYGWRVKLAHFNERVLAEYSVFWHHDNKLCYGDEGWVPDPPEVVSEFGISDGPPAGTGDPTGGLVDIDGSTLAVIKKETVVSDDGMTTTTTWTYNDDSQWIRTETDNGDGTITVTDVFPDGETQTVTVDIDGRGGEPGYIDPNTGSPREELFVRPPRTWREIRD